ncbi:hypothetical protein F2P56_006430 [Juglans regia]|uniref:Uncharacterized protein n=1 Tax=Juglans regia TaxID=51240 RepID=A0A833XZI0_JUGRE|nr:hypothetical protein F2P56_006430 [Juglans regia]
MAESDGGDQLLEVLAGDVLLEATLGDLVEELAAADELHDEIDLGLGGHDLEKLDNIGVADAAEDGDLSLDVGDEATLEDLLLVDNLDGDALVGLDVAGMIDLGKGTMAKELTDLKAAEEQGLSFLLGGGGFVVGAVVSHCEIKRTI